MSEAELAAAIARIEELDLEGLRAEWARRHAASLALRSVPILRMQLAWRLQCEVLGGLDPATRRALARKGRVRAEGLGLGPGTRLTPVWQGKLHEVMVEPDGFRWEGQVWRSLSAVASAIAGSRWNGPRFFGLRQ